MDDKNRDDFWDVDKLVPTRRDVKKRNHVSFDTRTAEVEIESKSAKSTETVSSSPLSREENTVITRFIPPHTSAKVVEHREPDLEYSRTGSLIRNVKIYNGQTKYSVYDRFTEDAIKLFKIKGEPCDHVPFFAYTPQYSQMNRVQLNWYLWWRDNFRRAACPYEKMQVWYYKNGVSETFEPFP